MSMHTSKIYFGLLDWINYINRKYSVLLQSSLNEAYKAYGNHSLLLEPLKKNVLNKPTF
jgi:hypothetical protein